MSDSDSEREQDGGASVAKTAVDSSDSDEREIQEIAPRFAKWHDTWDEFFACLREYEARTAQLYRIRSCMKVSARNEKIKKKKSWKESELVPDAFGDYYKKLLCTHGWEKAPRGEGKRTGHIHHSTNCGVNLSATVTLCPTTGTWRVHVSTHNRTHNHRLRREVYQNYPSTRRVTEPGVLDFVDELVKAGSKPKKILKYLQETTGKRVTLRDVHNLVHSLKAKRRGAATVEERLEAVLRKFCSVRGNTASIFVDDRKTTQTITMQTRQMRRFFEAFPEVVLLDSTHGTNAAKYKLFSFMIEDTFGHGQYVQHALVENESHACMKDAITAFKDNNPSWDQIRAFMVDKDFGEITLLQQEFPLSRVLICHFHLKKYLRAEMSKAIYGGRHGVDVDRVEDSLDMMVKARTKEEYDRGFRYMYYILDGFDEEGELPEPKHPLLHYFVRNWHSCKEMWSIYERGHVAHLGNHTNNRLESAWGALKEILRPEMELDECVETLFFLQSTSELEYASRFNVLGTRHYHGADEMLLRLSALVSPHAFELVRKEYELFKSGTVSYEGRWLQHPIARLKSLTTDCEYTVDVSAYTCSCFFMRTMLLPCHHTMFVRSSMDKKKVIPVNYIHARWLLQSEANRPEEDESDEDISCAALRLQTSHMRSVEHAVLNGSTKWKTGMDIAGGVVEAMCSQGTRTYLKMAEALREFGEYVKQGNVPNMSRAGQNSPDFADSDDSKSDNGSDVTNSGDSTCPSTRRATQASESNDRVLELDSSDGSDAGGILEGGSSEGVPCDAKERNPVKGKKKRDLATKATAKPKEDICAKTNSDSGSRGGSTEKHQSPLGKPDSNPNQLVSDPNQLVNDPNQLVNDPNQFVKDTNQLVKDPNQLVNDSNQFEKHQSPLGESDSNPNQLVKDPNQLSQDTNQLVNDPNQLVKYPNQLVLRKRRTTTTDESDDASSRDSSSSEGLTGKFIVSKAVKSKGRPKVRRKQVREAKRLRMRESKAEANELVQGTLIPVKDLSLVRKTLECNFNVVDALPVLNSITPQDSPTWKSTSIVLLAKKQKVHRKVTIVFPKNYVTKCIAGIKTYRKSLPSDHHAGRMGVSIKKMGTFAEEDLKTMHMWHDEYPKLVAVHDLAEWIRVSKFTRISLPRPLNNCTTVDLRACASRLELVRVTKLVSTRFGQVQVHELAFFRRSEWLDDSCLKIVMSHLIDQDQDKRGRSRIGGVNPLYARVHDESMKHEVIANSPCQTTNRLVLIPMYLESHWAGVVLDYEKRKAVMFDPMQTMANYKEITKILDKYFGEYTGTLDTVQQRAPRQEDINSCGPLTLLFFECAVRGIPVPTVSSEQVEYLRFRFFFLSSKGVFCRNPAVTVNES